MTDGVLAQALIYLAAAVVFVPILLIAAGLLALLEKVRALSRCPLP